MRLAKRPRAAETVPLEGGRPIEPRRMTTRSREPVILLPGAFGQDLLYWNLWQYFLERDGFHVYPFSFPRLTLVDLRLSARLLREKVDEVLEVEGAERVSLVGHSMGGLIGRYYVKHLRGAERVSRLCCMGVPHHGTWTALTGMPLKGTRQILPGSPFLRQLNEPTIPHGVPILNVWSGWDGVVIPARNAVLDLPEVDNRELPYMHHWRILVSRRAYTWVRDAMAAGAAESARRDVPEGDLRDEAPGKRLTDPAP
jgi:triacylglycerol lipase